MRAAFRLAPALFLQQQQQQHIHGRARHGGPTRAQAALLAVCACVREQVCDAGTTLLQLDASGAPALRPTAAAAAANCV